MVFLHYPEVVFAINGQSDYAGTLISGDKIISYDNASASITITPVDDGEVESSETVTLTLTTDCCMGSSYTIGSANTATVTIADDDVLPEVSIAATDATASEAGPTSGQFTVSRTGPTTAALTVYYTIGTESGAATWSGSRGG